MHRIARKIGGVICLSCLVSGCSGLMGDKALRERSKNNIMELSLAMHKYNQDQGYLPQNISSKDGKPLLSWRVALLPLLEHESVYKQFKLDEPWDSPHNQTLLNSMPSVYLPKGIKTPDPGLTYYQVFVSRPGTKPRAIFSPEDKWNLNQINLKDGTANTLLLVEAGNPVPWTKPADLEYAPDGPLPNLGGFSKVWFIGAYADGVVKVHRKEAPENLIRQVITVDGAEKNDLSPLYDVK